MALLSPTVAVTLIIVFVVAALLGRRKRPLPPGPKGLPILGNIFDVPKTREWLVYHEWARQYGGLNMASSSRIRFDLTQTRTSYT